MSFEDFTYELAELRDLARARGRERIGILRLLMAGMGDCEFPETRRWRRAALVALWIGAALMAAIAIAALIDRSGAEATAFGKICLMIGLGAFLLANAIAVFALAMRRWGLAKRLIALAKELDARASRLSEEEFDAVCDTLTYLPEWLDEADWPEDARCGCWNCIKMLPKQDYCPDCRQNRVVYGDDECPLDEAHLRRIHELML